MKHTNKPIGDGYGPAIVHYPRDGVTYTKSACGTHSISSALNPDFVTCPKCRRWMQEHGVIKERAIKRVRRYRQR